MMDKLFIPYTILRLRPRIRIGLKYPLTLNELTEFVKKVILVLKEELSDGYLTEREYRNYVRLFPFAADRVLARHSQMRDILEKEVVIPIIIDEWKENIEYRMTIRDAVDDLIFKQRWKIMLE